jgi:two-component system OmpR family sensor kinase
MKTKMFRSIRSRLTLWYALVLGIVFVVSGVILYRGFRISLIDTVDHTLYRAAERAETVIKRVPPTKWKESVKRVERAFLVNRLFIQLLQLPGQEQGNIRLLARSGVLAGNISLKDLWERMEHRVPVNPLYLDVNVNEKGPASHPLRIILYPVSKIKRAKGPVQTVYLIQVGISLKKTFNTLKKFLIILVVSSPVLLFVSVLGGYFILSGALRPVQMVVRTARRITAEDLGLRIETKDRKDEIGQLITTFNRMISRLERSVKQIKQFSGDASHDLKTPLTVIRGEIEVALRKERKPDEYKNTLANVREEAERLERVIDNLLFLSRIDAWNEGESFEMKPTPLDEILLDVFEKTQLLAQEKGISYLIGEMEAVTIEGSAVLLNRLIMNLLDNAIKYTEKGGRVEVSLDKADRNAVLTVRDTGIGIPEESLPFIFDRFYRVDQARSSRIRGSGLGLSIAKKIADIHQAVIYVESRINQGTTARIVFPYLRQPLFPQT